MACGGVTLDTFVARRESPVLRRLRSIGEELYRLLAGLRLSCLMRREMLESRDCRSTVLGREQLHVRLHYDEV